MKIRHLLIALSLCVLPTFAFAHPGHGNGMFAGMAHPWLGLDHMIAMMAVGMWASQQTGSVRWILPLSFVVMMVVGAVVGFGGVQLGVAQQVIAASVCVFGLVLSSAVRLPAVFCVVLTGCFAVFHGYAHAAEAVGNSAVPYMAGFVVSTALLHVAGFGVAMLLSKRQHLVRWMGAAMAVSGAVMLLG